MGRICDERFGFERKCVRCCVSGPGLIVFNIPAAEIPLGLNSTEAFALIVPGLPKTYPGGTVSIVLSVRGSATTPPS